MHVIPSIFALHVSSKPPKCQRNKLWEIFQQWKSLPFFVILSSSMAMRSPDMTPYPINIAMLLTVFLFSLDNVLWVFVIITCKDEHRVSSAVSKVSCQKLNVASPYQALSSSSHNVVRGNSVLEVWIYISRNNRNALNDLGNEMPVLLWVADRFQAVATSLSPSLL